MAQFFIAIRKDDVLWKIKHLGKRGFDTTPVMRAMGTTLMSITQGNFKASNAGFRPTEWPAKRDGSAATLQLSGLLSRSFHLKVGPDFAKVSNPTPYAAIHQFGARGHVAGKVVGTVKTKYANPKFKGSWQNVTQGGKGIPPRPFMPVLNNQLTPEAKKVIMAAGMRAIHRMVNGIK